MSDVSNDFHGHWSSFESYWSLIYRWSTPTDLCWQPSNMDMIVSLSGKLCLDFFFFFFQIWDMDQVGDWRNWFNSLGPSDAIWWCRSVSKLSQVMACCLTAPSHYLNQCWLIISKLHWHSYEGNLTLDALAISHKYHLENHLSKFSFKSPRGQWVNITTQVLFYYGNYCKFR